MSIPPDPDSRITDVVRYGELDGTPFVGLNGGPHFTFTEAVSFQIDCATQAEIDRYWEQLSAGGDPKAQQCGWLKDKFGLSWQVVPVRLSRAVTALRWVLGSLSEHPPLPAPRARSLWSCRAARPRAPVAPGSAAERGLLFLECRCSGSRHCSRSCTSP